MTPSRMILAAAGDAGMVLASPAGVTVDTERRVITGMAVPYGKPGQTSIGLLSFAQGSIALPADPSRVKLLFEHQQQREVIGHATALDDTPAGLLATFAVDESPAGDEAMRSAAAKMRDGLSVGVQPDDRTRQLLAKANARGGVTPATGVLREVSLVAVPAFDDARVASVAASSDGLVVSAWADPTPTERTTPMLCNSCGQAHPLGLACPTPAPTAEAAGRGRTGQNTDQPNTGEQTPPAGERQPTDPDFTPQTEQTPPNGGGDRPAVVQAAAGMVAVTSEPSVYAFGDDQFGTASTSLLADAAAAAFNRDPDAADRIARFNAQLAEGNPASVMALAAVAQTTDMPAGQFITQGYRPDLLRRAIDAGRPIASRLNVIPISNATPFAIPSVGEFDGVDDHVEGQASVADGTLGLGGDVVSPKAVSGSYRLSRELIDSSNPAVDRIAGEEMLRNYRRKSEDKVIAAIVAADASVTLNVNGVVALQGELVDFVDDDGFGADFVAMSRTFAKAMATDVDNDGRPFLNKYGQSVNAPGKAASSGYEVEGAELVRAFRMATDTAALIRASGVLLAESKVQQFRFEQPEGPGIIRLALWAYVGAKVLPAPVGGLPYVSRVTIAAV